MGGSRDTWRCACTLCNVFELVISTLQAMVLICARFREFSSLRGGNIGGLIRAAIRMRIDLRDSMFTVVRTEGLGAWGIPVLYYGLMIV